MTADALAPPDVWPPAPADADADVDPDAFTYLDVLVMLEDGRQFRALADHRDIRTCNVRYKITDVEADPIGFAMGLAHANLARSGQLELSWPDFQRCCMFAQLADRPTRVDPTPPAPAG